MKLSRLLNATSLCAWILAIQPARADLTHRWSFNDDISSTNATDSVGSATGVLQTGASYFGDGTVFLDGASGYVSFPNDLVSNYNSITYEAWFTDDGSGTWARLWDFGNSTGNGTSYMYLSPVNGGGNIQTAYNEGAGEQANVFTAGPRPSQNVEHHVVFTQDAATHVAVVYLDGKRVGQSTNFTFTPAGVGSTTNDWLGRSQYSSDAHFFGSIDEFRIWNTALSPQDVEASDESGPNTVSTNAGALTSISLQVPANALLGAVITPSLLGTFANLANPVDISLSSGIGYQSSDTNIFTFGSDGNFHAVGVGTATLTANYASLSSPAVVTVAAEKPVLLHRYSFNETSGATVSDSVGGADGTVQFYGVFTNGTLALDGNLDGGYVELPPGIIHTLTNATFETWITWNGSNIWQRIFDFGNSVGGSGVDYTILTPMSGAASNPLLFGINIGSEQDLNGGASLPIGTEVNVTVAYDATAHSAKIFVNGRLRGSGTLTEQFSGIADMNDWLGRSQFSGDPYFNGSYDEFRIYEGAESDLQVAVDAAAGPDNIVTNSGALVSIKLAATNTVDIHGTSVPVGVSANFANISNVDVGTLAETTITSSDTSVATIVNGNIVPQNTGVTTIKATYGGMSDSVQVTVVDTELTPTLLHRWTFNEAPGSTSFADSVGSINGTVQGLATFDGSQLLMPAGNPAPSGGQPTASSGWASFPANQGLVTSLPDEASFDIWVVWHGGAVWQEMFDFGQAATPGVSSGGGQYVMISPYDGSDHLLRAEWDQNPVGYDVVLHGPALDTNVLSQVVWTHDQVRHLDKLYRNGQLVATAANTGLWSTLPDTDNWLARDEWPDAMFNGNYVDFRIWSGALTPPQVANLYQSGPDSTSLAARPKLQISVTGSQATLSWPAGAAGFTPQSSTDLASGTWTTVSGTPTVVNGMNTLSVTNNGQTQVFYRLKQ